jgi:hypothetical protein
MDTETVKALFELLSHGGSVATIAAVWMVSRASKTATDAVDTLKRIEAGNAEVARVLAQHRQTMDQKLDKIHDDIQSLPLTVVRARRAAPIE